ncbi:hypothetical protein JI735_33865 (plasmid) [Paenibacillus sonchi]|uniref:Uncharacterized protein n=1 Tax=Paenibacillus sonchi TaxID=373687 RepID=A0A974PIM3_9BACL|nr:hypothetical protein [Paenibacillus sonchi]QQZ64637.1 hypothetical protein JI735_33865 [Paenibacillus sonchi]
MYTFYDPSIKPILTTNHSGEFISVKTEGLKYYGISDIVLYQYIDGYESLFLSIIELIFKGEFNIQQTWNYNGQIFKLEKRVNGYLEICFNHSESIQIVTIVNPISGEPIKYLTKGIIDKYGTPEFEIQASYFESKGILAYVISEIYNGKIIDELTLIELEGNTYIIEKTIDRYGASVYQVELLEAKKIIHKELKRRSHLKRIK